MRNNFAHGQYDPFVSQDSAAFMDQVFVKFRLLHAGEGMVFSPIAICGAEPERSSLNRSETCLQDRENSCSAFVFLHRVQVNQHGEVGHISVQSSSHTAASFCRIVFETKVKLKRHTFETAQKWRNAVFNHCVLHRGLLRGIQIRARLSVLKKARRRLEATCTGNQVLALFRRQEIRNDREKGISGGNAMNPAGSLKTIHYGSEWSGGLQELLWREVLQQPLCCVVVVGGATSYQEPQHHSHGNTNKSKHPKKIKNFFCLRYLVNKKKKRFFEMKRKTFSQALSSFLGKETVVKPFSLAPRYFDSKDPFVIDQGLEVAIRTGNVVMLRLLLLLYERHVSATAPIFSKDLLWHLVTRALHAKKYLRCLQTLALDQDSLEWAMFAAMLPCREPKHHEESIVDLLLPKMTEAPLRVLRNTRDTAELRKLIQHFKGKDEAGLSCLLESCADKDTAVLLCQEDVLITEKCITFALNNVAKGESPELLSLLLSTLQRQGTKESFGELVDYALGRLIEIGNPALFERILFEFSLPCCFTGLSVTWNWASGNINHYYLRMLLSLHGNCCRTIFVENAACASASEGLLLNVQALCSSALSQDCIHKMVESALIHGQEPVVAWLLARYSVDWTRLELLDAEVYGSDCVKMVVEKGGVPYLLPRVLRGVVLHDVDLLRFFHARNAKFCHMSIPFQADVYTALDFALGLVGDPGGGNAECAEFLFHAGVQLSRPFGQSGSMAWSILQRLCIQQTSRCISLHCGLDPAIVLIISHFAVNVYSDLPRKKKKKRHSFI